jgi:glc operon protein GlcG
MTKWEEVLTRRFAVTLLAAGTALTVGGQALAQAPAPAPVPDLMPFDIPYGPSITVDRAAQVVAAAVAEAKKAPRNWKLAITVVDPNGDLVYFYKMDQTQIASVAISQGKARTAAHFRRPSGAFFNLMQTPAGADTVN